MTVTVYIPTPFRRMPAGLKPCSYEVKQDRG
jgi:hypothetical protein